jgi:acetoin utilization protein AcuB
MITKELLSETIAPLNPSDSAAFALGIMDEFKISHLPIVENQIFQGLISDTDIYNFNNFDEPVGNHILSLAQAYVTENQHIYDAIKIFSTLSLSLLPVVSENHQYLGMITQANLIKHLAGIFAISNPGGVIILELNEKDYFLTEIAKIVESGDAKLLSLSITSFPDSTKLEVTIKLNKMDIEAILQTFNRYNYSVKASFSENLNYESLKERFDSLMNYLNV